MENSESQEMELIALESIFEEEEFIVDSMNPPCGRFVAHVRLPQNFYICKVPQSECKNLIVDNTHTDKTFQVENLPPIILFFEFTKSYPQKTCPAFLLSCNWLTLRHLSVLCKHLESLWELSKDAILYTWIQFLQDEVLDFLNIRQCLDISELLKYKMNASVWANVISEEADTRVSELKELVLSNDETSINGVKQKHKTIRQSISIKPSVCGGSGTIDIRALNELCDGKNLVQSLKDYDEDKKEEVYKNTTHLCDVCFLAKIGSDFVKFKICGHSFCKECLKLYYEVQIVEGNVNSLNCPAGKCSSQADGSMVRQIVSEELFQKYDKLLLARTLESMSDVTYCPRQPCQFPVLIESCGKMGACSKCEFIFCALCNMAYHGVAPCNFKSEQRQRILERYMTGTTVEKEAVEKQYGKRVVKNLVEDSLSENWKDSHSKSCPRCNASIEKTEGCNKMTCFRCGTFFCWLCNAKLQPSNPYLHFSDIRSECYDQLFPDNELDFELDFEFDIEPGEFLDNFP